MASSNVEANRILKPRRRLVQEQQFDNTNSNKHKHKIVFKFEPKSVAIGMIINTIFSLIILAGLAYLAFKEFRDFKAKKVVGTV